MDLKGSLRWVLMVCLFAWNLCGASQAKGGALNVNADGTATLVGTVVGEWRGCEVDGSCGLWVIAGQEKVGLVTAEGDLECKNSSAAKAASHIKRGQRIKAYGAYKGGKLTFCGSKTFYIAPESVKSK
jgi:hypothetical protein